MADDGKFAIVKIKCPHVVDNRHYWTAIIDRNFIRQYVFEDIDSRKLSLQNLQLLFTTRIGNFLNVCRRLKKFDFNNQYNDYQIVDQSGAVKPFLWEWARYWDWLLSDDDNNDSFAMGSNRCPDPDCRAKWPTVEHLAKILTSDKPKYFTKDTIDINPPEKEVVLDQSIIDHVRAEVVVAKIQILRELRRELETMKQAELAEKMKRKQEKKDLKGSSSSVIRNQPFIIYSQPPPWQQYTRTPPANQSVPNMSQYSASTDLAKVEELKKSKLDKHLPKEFFDKCQSCEDYIKDNVFFVSFDRSNKDKDGYNLSTLCQACVALGVHYHRVMIRLPRQCAYRPTAIHPAMEGVLRLFKKSTTVNEHRCGASCPFVDRSKMNEQADYNIVQSLNEVEKLTEMMQANRSKIESLDSAVEKSFPKQKHMEETKLSSEPLEEIKPQQLSMEGIEKTIADLTSNQIDCGLLKEMIRDQKSRKEKEEKQSENLSASVNEKDESEFHQQTIDKSLEEDAASTIEHEQTGLPEGKNPEEEKIENRPASEEKDESEFQQLTIAKSHEEDVDQTIVTEAEETGVPENKDPEEEQIENRSASIDEKDDASLISSEIRSTINGDEFELVDDSDDIAYPSSDSRSAGRSISRQMSEYEDADQPLEDAMFISTTTTVLANGALSEDSIENNCIDGNVTEVVKVDGKEEHIGQETPVVDIVPPMVTGSGRTTPSVEVEKSSSSSVTTEPVNNWQTSSCKPPILEKFDSDERVNPWQMPATIAQDLKHGLDVASSAINNVAMQVGRAVTMKQQNWSPPPPQNPFNKLAKGATPDEYTGWVPKSTQTTSTNTIQPQIPLKYRTELIDIDDSIGHGLATMVEMGFDNVPRVVRALRAKKGDVEQAIEMLIEEDQAQ